MTETEKMQMQWMANGIILTCHLLVSDDLCENKKEAVSTIFSETGITKDEFKMCDDVISKNTIMKLFGGMKTDSTESRWKNETCYFFEWWNWKLFHIKKSITKAKGDVRK